MKVNVMLIGAARSATTSLSQILAAHPDISFSRPKEPQFFSRENWRDDIVYYHSLFSEGAKIYAEGSTNYSKFPSFNKKIYSDIYEYNPDMKFIYIMRNPIDRIISHYKFSIERGYTKQDLDTEILNNPIYINTSKYYSQIKPYIDQFGPDQIKLIFFDDFTQHSNDTIQDILKFIGLKPFAYSKKFLKANMSSSGRIGHKKFDRPKTIWRKIGKGLFVILRQFRHHPQVSRNDLQEETIAFIKKELIDDINQLGTLVNKDLSNIWLQ